MPKLRRVLKYAKNYGLRSALGLAREKLVVDRKRFSPDIERKIPSFPKEYNSPNLNFQNSDNSPYTVLYLVHYFYPERKGGTERFTLNIAKEAERRGAKPIVLVLDADSSENGYTGRHGDILYRYYDYDGIRCIGFRYKKAPLGLYYK
ncbi:MAG: hypothetical protein IKY62_02080, partial [Clostridia bacterium]|nr:hypothetical protein [Clostridia bacterium]